MAVVHAKIHAYAKTCLSINNYLNGSSQLLDDLDVLEVDVRVGRRIDEDLEDGVDCDGRQLGVAVLRHDLRVERCVG